jgi:hypothetical protein
LIQVWATAGTLRWSYLDSAWLQEQAARQLSNRAGNNGKMVLTAPSAALGGFLAKYASDDKPHGGVKGWQRLQSA